MKKWMLLVAVVALAIGFWAGHVHGHRRGYESGFSNGALHNGNSSASMEGMRLVGLLTECDGGGHAEVERHLDGWLDPVIITLMPLDRGASDMEIPDGSR